jgi:glycerol-3-phosphate responsive antiterminator
MEYDREDFLVESEDDEYIVSCVVDLMRRTFILHSNEGNSKTANCETSEEFMDVIEVIRAVLPEKIIKYVQPYE